MLTTVALTQYVLPRQACVDGPKIAQYEKAFADRVGAHYAIGFWKGRVGFYVALKALDVGEGDEVIMPGYTCMVVPAAVKYLGATPVYVDIEPTYCTLDPDKLAGAITSRTKAMMIQHTYGWPSAGLDQVVDIAKRKGVPVLEDCCHTQGTTWKGRHVGNFGVAGFFSSQWSKPFTTGLGGMLVCNDTEFYERVCRIRDEDTSWPSSRTAAQLACQRLVFEAVVYPATMAIARNTYRWLSNHSIVTGSTAKQEYCNMQPDYLKRLCEVQAADGLMELSRLDDAIAHRTRLSAWYRDALAGAGWSVPDWPEGRELPLLRFPVRVQNKKEALRLSDKYLLEIGDWFIRPLHSHLADQEPFGYRTGMCPEGDRAAREMVNLPVHARVTRRHAGRALKFVLDHCQPVA